jgi:DNA-binding winged helix-turn-helix (wHTH) protein/tetratricopeptide (TPR) repeat protein
MQNGEKSTQQDLSTHRIFHFGQFEARVASGKLLRQGRAVQLQDQPFRLLVALLERAGNVVSRQELKDSLWRHGTLVEFDKSLDVAMAKLRHALHDDSNSPVFIQTLPKRGYQFIAPVTIPGVSAETPGQIPLSPPPPPPAVVAAPAGGADAAASPPRTAARVPRSLAPVALAGLLLAIAAYWVWQRPNHLPERAAVLVGEFSNATGDASFDRSLRTATIIDLGQSPYLTIVSDPRIGVALQALGRPPEDPLQPAVLRQVCQREHAAAAITGSIERADAGYLLKITASRCSDGSVLATSGFRVATKDRVLTDLATAVVGLRQEFGESKESLRQYDVVAVQATTNSLEALKAYQLGMDLRSHTRNIDAISAFKASIRLDPTFAIAYAQLGSCYSNLQETELAIEFFQKAFDLREHATEPERLLIAGRYFDIVTGEVEKGSGIYKLWTDIYPNDWLGHNALANDANMLGRYDVAATEAEHVILLEPDHAYGYTNRAVALLGLNRLSEATAVAREAVRRGRDGDVIHGVLYGIALINGDAAGLAQERTWAASHPDELNIPYGEAELAEAQGKIKASARLYSQLADHARSQGLPGEAAVILAGEGEFDMEMGLLTEALVHARAAAELGNNEEALELIALVYARAGDAVSVRAVTDQINNRFPLSTYNISVFAPTVRTALAMAGPLSAAQVTDWMRPALPYEIGRQAVLTPLYIRGLAYLHAHAAGDAEREFRRLIDHRGAEPASPLFPLAYLGLAESLVAQGRTAEAAEAYEYVLAFWQDADPDLPVLLQAQREYQLLKRA